MAFLDEDLSNDAGRARWVMTLMGFNERLFPAAKGDFLQGTQMPKSNQKRTEANIAPVRFPLASA